MTYGLLDRHTHEPSEPAELLEGVRRVADGVGAFEGQIFTHDATLKRRENV